MSVWIERRKARTPIHFHTWKPLTCIDAGSMNGRSLPTRLQICKEYFSLCSQCSRSPARSSPARRQLGTFAKEPPLSSRQTYNVANKEYFWANGILEQVLRSSKKGLKQDAGRGQEHAAGVKEALAGFAKGATTQQSLQQEELPHRRRKRLRDEEKEITTGASTDYPIPLDASSRLSSLSSTLPNHSVRRLLTTCLSLSKPRLTFLIMLTTTGAYSLFPVPALLSPEMTSTPSLSTLTLLFLTTGTGLASASANALNMLMEPEHDAKMSRTRNRPLVRGLISKRGALLFAILSGTAGVAALYFGTTPTTAFLGALNIGLYAGVYTPLKRLHPVNTWVGALVGGIPPLMGWTAAAGQCATEGGTWQELLLGSSSAGGWLLAGLLYAWQFPHFNALSWAIRDEYKAAGYRMLCWTNTAMNGRVALRYSLLMFPVCIGLSAAGVTDWSFVVTSSAVNGWMTYQAIRFWRWEGQKGAARALFWASVWHLPIVLVLAMVQKQGLWDRLWRGLEGRGAADDEEEYEDENEEDVEEVQEDNDDGQPAVILQGRLARSGV